MEGLQIELILRLDRNETHVLSFHGLGDRFRVAVIVLVGFTKGRTNCAGIRRTSCPCSRRARPRKCDPTPASIPINDEGSFFWNCRTMVSRDPGDIIRCERHSVGALKSAPGKTRSENCYDDLCFGVFPLRVAIRP